MKVLSFGSLNIDYVYKVPHFIKGGETLASLSLEVFVGGKGLNQSVALSNAGLSVYHAGAVGKEGAMLTDYLKSAGVNTDYVECRENIRSGHTIIQNNNDGDNCIILYGGANQSITKTQIDKTLENFSSDDALVLQNEINELEYLSEKAKSKGMIIALNPSPMDENIVKLIPNADYILLNEIEAGQVLGQQCENYDKTAEALHKKFPSLKIVLTLGTHGSIYVDGNSFVKQDSFKVEAVDTTAAGDTFTGFFLAGIFNGDMPSKAMKFASLASSIAVTRKGAAPSIPLRNEVLEKMQSMK